MTKSPVKVTWRYLEDGTKVRVTRGKLASGSIIQRPDILTQRRKPIPVALGDKDTPQSVANEITHTPGDLPTALKRFLEEQGHGSNEKPTRFKYSRRALYMSPPQGIKDALKDMTAQPSPSKE